MIENIDDNIGRLSNALDSLGLKENTVIIFLSDNGPNGVRHNGGMKGIKAQVDEGSVRVPFLISWPGKIPAGRLVKELGAHIDLLPTILDMTGIQAEKDILFDGKSLWPLLQGNEEEWNDRPIFTIQSNGLSQSYPSSIRTKQYRMVWDWANIPSLYDMMDDPKQEANIINQKPKQMKTPKNQKYHFFLFFLLLPFFLLFPFVSFYFPFVSYYFPLVSFRFFLF